MRGWAGAPADLVAAGDGPVLLRHGLPVQGGALRQPGPRPRPAKDTQANTLT